MLTLRARMASPHCVYALRDAFGNVVYVGQSLNLLQRIGQHRRRGLIPFIDWISWRCFESEKDGLEAKLISKFNPRYNIQRPIMVELTEAQEISLSKLVKAIRPLLGVELNNRAKLVEMVK